MDLKERLPKEIGKRFEKISEKNTDIANIIGVGKSRISKIIKGDSLYLSYYQLYQLQIEFGIDLNELITGKQAENMTNQIEGDNITSIQIQASPNEQILKELVETQREMIEMLKEQLENYKMNEQTDS